MASSNEIIPLGALVRVEGSVIGSVDRGDERDDKNSFLVVSMDRMRTYRLRTDAVREVDDSTSPPVVVLSVSLADLPSFASDELRQRRDEGWEPDLHGEMLRVPLAAEQLTASRTPYVRGRVHLRKGTETVEQQMTVPVYHEELIVEHIPVDQYDPQGASSSDIILPVVEERVVVERKLVVKEYIRVVKTRIEEQREVVETLRREVVSVTENEIADGAVPTGTSTVQTTSKGQDQ